MVPDRVGLVLPGGWVLLSPRSARHCDRALAAAVRSTRRDHIPIAAEVRALVTLLASAVEASALPVTEVPDGAAGSLSDRLLVDGSRGSRSAASPLTTGSVAELLGITERGVRDLCSRGALPGEKVAGRWLIAWPDLEEYAQTRAAREAGRPNDESVSDARSAAAGRALRRRSAEREGDGGRRPDHAA